MLFPDSIFGAQIASLGCQRPPAAFTIPTEPDSVLSLPFDGIQQQEQWTITKER